MDGFQTTLCSGAFDESRLSIGRVNVYEFFFKLSSSGSLIFLTITCHLGMIL